MSEERSVSGSCACDAVRFHVQLPSLYCGHCHCSICRRNHGAAFVTWFGVPEDAFSVESGKEHLSAFESSEHAKRYFCRLCGSSLFTQSSTHRSDQIDVVLANIHEPIDRAPQAHVFFDDHVPWIDLGDELPRLGGMTDPDPTDPES